MLKKTYLNVALVRISRYSTILIFGDLKKIICRSSRYFYSVFVIIHMLVVTLDAKSHRI